jgi:hypothetical protein
MQKSECDSDYFRFLCGCGPRPLVRKVYRGVCVNAANAALERGVHL